MVRKAKKKPTAKQLAARRKFVAMVKSGAFRKKVHAAPKRKARKHARRSAFGQGRHRPVVIKRGKRLYRPRRSSLPKHASFANPFLGELALIGGNPMARRRKHRSHRKSHRRSHRRSMSLYRNPIGGTIAAVTAGPREIVRVDFLKEAAGVAAGFALTAKAVEYVPAAWVDATWKRYAVKVGAVGIATALAHRFASKRVRDAVLLGGGLAVLLDLYGDFVAPAIGFGPGPRLQGMDAYYGEPTNAGLSAYYGEPTNAELSGMEDTAINEFGNPY